MLAEKIRTFMKKKSKGHGARSKIGLKKRKRLKRRKGLRGVNEK